MQPSTSPRTSSGWFSTSSWAIIPPIDTPNTCAGPTFSSRRSPAASSAIMRIVYSVSGLSLSPVPRLEKRIVWKWGRRAARISSPQELA